MADPGPKRGMVFSAASAVLFGVTPAVASRIYSMGGNAVTLTFYRNLMAVPVLLALLGLEGVSLRLTRREAGLLLLMGAGFRVTTTLMLYQSYLYIPTGMATPSIFSIRPLLPCCAVRASGSAWVHGSCSLWVSPGWAPSAFWSWAPEQIQGESSWPPPQL